MEGSAFKGFNRIRFPFAVFPPSKNMHLEEVSLLHIQGRKGLGFEYAGFMKECITSHNTFTPTAHFEPSGFLPHTQM